MIFRLPQTLIPVLLCLAAGCASLVRAQEADIAAVAAANASRAEENEPLSAEELSQLVAQLDSSQFDDREHAQIRLRQAGSDAVEEVSRVARNGSLESSTRALNILLDWAESKNTQLAITSLKKLSELENRPREAKYAAKLLGDLQERRALERLVEHGAVFRLSGYPLVFNQMAPPPGLHVLIGKDWKGGTESFALLAEVPRITQLSLYSPPVDDGAVNYISQLPNLQHVELFGTKFSPAAIDRIRQQVAGKPSGMVDVREGAFLGIRGQDFNADALVVDVVAGGAAEKAGIQAGDVITHFAGKQVTSFRHLTELIGEYKEGDSAKLTIFRTPAGANQARARQLRQINGQIQQVPIPAAQPQPAGKQAANPPAAQPAAAGAPVPAEGQQPTAAEEESSRAIEMTVKFDRWSLTSQQAGSNAVGNVNDLPLNPFPHPHYERR